MSRRVGLKKTVKPIMKQSQKVDDKKAPDVKDPAYKQDDEKLASAKRKGKA